MDGRSSVSTTSSQAEVERLRELEEEEERGGSYAEEVASRVRREKERQSRPAVSPVSAQERTGKPKTDPYAMLPARYRTQEEHPRSQEEPSVRSPQPEDEAPPKEAPLSEQLQQLQKLLLEEGDEDGEEEKDSERHRPASHRPLHHKDYDPLEDFNPAAFADFVEHENTLRESAGVRKGFQHWDADNGKDRKFDLAQSVLEDMVESDRKFHALQRNLKEEHCRIFEDAEENKLEYMPVYRKWVDVLDRHVTQKLRDKIHGFNLEDFMEILEERREEVSSSLWQFLLSLTDFEAFKREMLNYKTGVTDENDSGDMQELVTVINEGDAVMQRHFEAAAKQREQALVQDALEKGTEASRSQAVLL